MNSIVALPIYAATPTAAPAFLDDELDALWRERAELIARSNALHERFEAATKLLPAWANSGPEMIDSDGKRCGHIVGWPEVADLPSLPRPGAYRVIRTSPQRIKQDYESYVSLFPRSAEIRAKSRASYRSKMRRLISRIREQREIERSLGLTAMEKEIDAMYDRRWELQDRILAASSSVNQAAAAALVEASCEIDASCSVKNHTQHFVPVVILLSGIRSYLTGAVRETVDAMFDRPTASMASLNVFSA